MTPANPARWTAAMRAAAVAALASNAPGIEHIDVSNEAYAQSVGLPFDTGGKLAPGEIYVANDDRFVQAFYQEPVTEYAVSGWDMQDTAAELRAVCGEIPVARRFEYATWTNEEQFQIRAAGDDSRALLGDFTRVEYTSTKVNAKTLNRGLTIRLDRDEVSLTPNWEQAYTNRLVAQIQRNALYRAYALLGTSAVNTNRTWTPSSSVDPDGDIRSSIFQGQLKSGLRPNTVVWGRTAWDKRFLAYRQDSNAARADWSRYDPEAVRAVLGVKSVAVSESMYQSSATAKTELVGSLVLSFYSQPNPSREDPSNIKRFVSNTRSGGRLSVYITPESVDPKFVQITVEYNDLIAVPYTGGIRKDTVA
jgi:hypothetical protein